MVAVTTIPMRGYYRRIRGAHDLRCKICDQPPYADQPGSQVAYSSFISFYSSYTVNHIHTLIRNVKDGVVLALLLPSYALEVPLY